MNPIQQALNAGGSPVQNLIGTLKSARNPALVLQQMAGQNPIVKQAMDMVQQNGGDAKTAFYSMANQMGVDPNYILNMLK